MERSNLFRVDPWLFNKLLITLCNNLIMPSRNKIKIYLPNSVYHVYNRGVGRRRIFNESTDYAYFLNQLKAYVLPRSDAMRELTSRCKSVESLMHKTRKISNMPCYCGKVKILAFALMPNHFHLLIKQTHIGDMTKFMRSLGTSYSMYFNLKYNRVGSLYQDIYKARLIMNDEDLLITTNYIHLNPREISKNIENYPMSSLRYYRYDRPSWVSTNEALTVFRKSPYYKRFSNYIDYVKDQP